MMRKLLLFVLPVLCGLLLPAGLLQAQSLGLPTGSTGGETEAAPKIDEAKTRALIETLEDPAQRAKLVEQLEALLQVAEPQEPEVVAEDAVGWMLGEISDRTDIVRQVVRTVVDSLDEVPVLASWLERQMLDPASREVWLWVGYRVALVLGLGLTAMLAMSIALRRIRRNLTESAAVGLSDRFSRMFLWLIIELMPVVAFAIAAYGTLGMLEMQNLGRLVVLPLVNAVILVRSGIAFLRVTLAPKAPTVRVLPLADPGAIYANRWLRRLLATSVYGYFILLAAKHLGLPWTLHGLLVHLLFFAIAVMVMTIIVQRREPVAHAIARFGEDERRSALRRLPWATVASLWHVLALIYVLFIYLVWALKIPGGFQALIEATLGSAAIVALGWFVWRALDQILTPRLRPTDEDGGLSPLERRVARYLPLLAGASRAAVILMVILGLFEVWGFGTLTWLFSESGNTVLGNVLTVLIIAAITVGIWETISFLIERSISETDDEGNLKLSNRTRTILNITRNLLLVLLSLVALFLILAEMGLDVAPLLAGAGVIGLAIGFGSQKLVQDIITGMFMLLGDTIRVGDVVTLSNKTGIVEEVSMRTVQLRDYGGNVHTIPYSAIDTVTNLTKEFSYAVFDIGVAYRESVDEVIQVLREIGAEMSRDAYFRRLLLEPLEVAGLDQFGASALVIRCRFKTRPLKQWEVSREFNRRVKNRFDQLGIEIPFPHQTVYFGQDKEGRAPPALVRLQQEQAAAGSEETRELVVDERATPLRAQSSRG
jgi:small-conductance mechanosensitive channel